MESEEVKKQLLAKMEDRQIKNEQFDREHWYKRAIEILSFDTINFKRVAVMLAQLNPELFCTCAGDPAPSAERFAKMFDLQMVDLKQISLFVAHGDKVNAIKRYRNAKGAALKEAADFVREHELALEQIGQTFQSATEKHDEDKTDDGIPF